MLTYEQEVNVTNASEGSRGFDSLCISTPSDGIILSINTYIYIFSHNLCKMQVFKLVFESINPSLLQVIPSL